jgi:hypothetical protein
MEKRLFSKVREKLGLLYNFAKKPLLYTIMGTFLLSPYNAMANQGNALPIEKSLEISSKLSYSEANDFADLEKKTSKKPYKKKVEQISSILEFNKNMFAGEKMTSEGMFSWYKNTNTMFQKKFEIAYKNPDFSCADEKVKRLMFLGFYSILSGYINYALGSTAHELGHMEKAQAIGAHMTEFRKGNEKISIGELFLNILGDRSHLIHFWKKNNMTFKEKSAVSGAGINVNERLANLTAKKIQLGEGHIMDAAPYTLNKIWGLNYFSTEGNAPQEFNDAIKYVDILQKQGFKDVTKEDIIKLQATSFLFSGGTWNMMKGVYKFINEGEEKVEPMGVEVGNTKIMMPELTTWLNPDNVSLGIQTRIKNKQLPKVLFLFGLEKSIFGNKNVKPEITTGFNTKLEDLEFEAEITSNGSNPYLEGKISKKFYKGFSIFTNVYFGQGKTQREQRERLKSSKGCSVGFEYKF